MQYLMLNRLSGMLAALILLGSWTDVPVRAADFKQDFVYQIVTDRFCNGRTDNDDPPQSKGMFDPTHSDWHAYWGGDLAGIRAKLSYIKNLGATAIWISPIIDNVNTVSSNAQRQRFTPYHGYHARDFKRVDEHFGDRSNSWHDFDQLTKTAHTMGLKVITDFPANHTNQYDQGERGALYGNGHFKCEPNFDKNKYFHHLPEITDWNDRFQLQYGTFSHLADLNQENSFIDCYLKEAAIKVQNHGADATRLDAAKDITWGWEHSLANYLNNHGDHLVVAEWWVGSTDDPVYPDGIKFANKSGISLFDFPLAFAMRNAFVKEDGSFIEVDRTIQKENHELIDPNGMFTFIDNHDLPRFLSLKNDESRLRLALALLMTCRGTPNILYGTEQNLHDDTNNGDDPYDRVWMSKFEEESSTYKLIQLLSSVRSANLAFAYGDTKTLAVTKDIYVFERRFGDSIVVTAINKNANTAITLSGTITSLPGGAWNDSLGGKMNGVSVRVDKHGTMSDIATSGKLNASTASIMALSLPANSVSIWSRKASDEQAKPLIANVGPLVVNGGLKVTITGRGFGAKPGKVLIGDKAVSVQSWSSERIRFTAPKLIYGKLPVRVVTRAGLSSNQSGIQIVENRLIPITFKVKNPPSLAEDEQLFIAGNVLSLGSGQMTRQEAAGPVLFSANKEYILCVAMPIKRSVQVKLFILNREGKIVDQEKQFHTYKVPALGTGQREISWTE